MEHPAEKLDRRRSFRVSVRGTASLWEKGYFIGNYIVEDLSIGGCLLVGLPECEIGRSYDIELIMPAVPLSNVRANVVRHQIGSKRSPIMGVNFDEVSATFEDSVHDLVVSSLEQKGYAELISVMVLHPHTETRDSIADALRRIGYRVIPVSTPLEAIWTLEDGKSDIHTLIVSRFIGTCDGQEMMKFMATHFPNIRRVMTTASDALPQKHSTNYAHAIIAQPWDVTHLQKVLLPLNDVNKYKKSRHDIQSSYQEKEVLSA